MNAFSQDVDLLRLEPSLFRGASFRGPVLCKGVNGQLSGTTLTAAGENFVSRGVAPGHVIYLSDGVGNIDDAYEVVSVNSATQLTVSILRADRTAAAIAVGTGSNLYYRLGTFDAKARRVMQALTSQLGIRPGIADSSVGVEDLLDPEPLRDVSALMCLGLICTGLYQMEETDGIWLQKKEHYERLARQARTQTIVRFDLDGDGVYERSLCGGYACLLRE